MMDCEHFLAGYSAYRDGEVSWGEREAFEAHIDDCPACARYHRVVGKGVELFRGLPELEVSDDFAARLQHRLYGVDAEAGRAGRRASAGAAVATFAVAAVIAMAAWVPLMQPRPAPLELPGVAAAVPAALPGPEGVAAVVRSPTQDALTEELADAGVQVRDFPYHDLLFHRDDALGVSLALSEAPADAPAASEQ
ncbi:MAG TPA: zf-HC2 domain-containing protein [Longimicrobiaceae bacterium]|nr:zf-HC2 domain-containing protein [Longimicrobiaceae bacterium]